MAQDFRSLRGAAQSIGFHELRQACEISVLREDLERIARDATALRDHVEEAVEQVRARFAELTEDDLADADRMAPLLQFAVATLIDIRDTARRVNTETGGVADADRSFPPSLRAVPAGRPDSPPPVAAPMAPSMAPPPTSAPSPAPTRLHPEALPPQPPPQPFIPPAPVRAAPPAEPPRTASWLLSQDQRPARGPTPGAGADGPRDAAPAGNARTIDWLGR